MGYPFTILTIATGICVFALARVVEAKTTPTVQGAVPDDQVCQKAIQSAEQTLRLPAQLLGAIGLVESGRVIPATRRIASWPWTINVGGSGYFYDTKDQAIIAAQGYLAKGIQSIDIGCMQVNLSYHPAAFVSLDQAFDPVVNATYAAKFLIELYAQSHLWTTAAASYHSQTPGVSDVYVRRVIAAWPLAGRYIEPGVLTAIGAGIGVSLPTAHTNPPSTCEEPDLSRYTPEFRKIIIQASIDHARLLAYMGVGNQPNFDVGCPARPGPGLKFIRKPQRRAQIALSRESD